MAIKFKSNVSGGDSQCVVMLCNGMQVLLLVSLLFQALNQQLSKSNPYLIIAPEKIFNFDADAQLKKKQPKGFMWSDINLTNDVKSKNTI